MTRLLTRIMRIVLGGLIVGYQEIQRILKLLLMSSVLLFSYAFMFGVFC